MSPKRELDRRELQTLAERQDKEIAAHSRKLTRVEERLVELETKLSSVSKVNLVLAQLCEELGYNNRTIADHVGLPHALLMNPGGPFFEPDDIG